jgi:putative oxidoreductase
MRYIHLTGRVLLASLFIIVALTKLGVLGMLGTYENFIEFMTVFGVPLPNISHFFATALELVGGVALLVGYKTRWAALALAIYLIPISFFFHTNFDDPIQFVKFIKNFAILGSLLMLASLHEVPLSLEHRLRSKVG